MLSRRDFLKLLSSTGTGLFFAQYARENPKIKRVYLFETRVAGFQYHDGMKPEIADLLVPPLDLALVREPENPYDELAIAVYTQQGHHLGYVPRGENEIPSAIADQDVFIGAELLRFDRSLVKLALWDCLRIRIFQAVKV